jgi:RimJ/RimL family protein N-acetyltransferase
MDHTTLQGEAMASQRQLERLWKQVQRLHQRDEYWATTSRLARMWITPKHAPPYRPYVILVLSQHGKIVSSHVLEQPPTTEALFAELLRAMRRPAWGAGGARRPTRIYLDSLGIFIFCV